jgi:magnesium transporter
MWSKLHPERSAPKNFCQPRSEKLFPWQHNPTSSQAAMRPTLHVPAPSSALLKFLKSQTDAACFCNASLQPGLTTPSTPSSNPHLRSNLPCSIPRTVSRYHTTSVALPSTSKPAKGLFRSPRTRLTHQSPRLQCRSILNGRPLGTHLVSYSQRNGSTWSRPWVWMDKLRHNGRRARGGKLRPDDLPRGREDSTETSVFSLGRAVSAKAAAQPKVRCTELDEYGNVTLASGEFKKSELIAKVQFLYMLN